MGSSSRVNCSPSPAFLHNPSAPERTFLPPLPFRSKQRSHATIRCSGSGPEGPAATAAAPASRTSGELSIAFQTLKDCKLGISRYPDFDYDANGGKGTSTGRIKDAGDTEEVLVSFDVGSLYIPPLMSSTTRLLGIPLPPFLRIDIVPELLEGVIDRGTGKVDLDFRAKFWFSVGSVYRAPPLLVGTKLTSEESKGTLRGGKGKRMDQQGRCTLVGVALVDPISNVLMDSFLALPTECLAVLNARIEISDTS